MCSGVGMTALSEAARCGRKELAEMLVDRGANIQHADIDGMSPIVQTDFTSHSDNRTVLKRDHVLGREKRMSVSLCILIAKSL